MSHKACYARSVYHTLTDQKQKNQCQHVDDARHFMDVHEPQNMKPTISQAGSKGIKIDS